MNRMAIVTLWWFISARKWFKGPVINVEHAMLSGEGAVLDGVEHEMENSSDSDVHNKKAEVEGTSAPAYNDIESR